MLVERVDRREQLDDGRMQTTTLDITPTAHSDVPDMHAMPDMPDMPAASHDVAPMSPVAPAGMNERTADVDHHVQDVPVDVVDVVDGVDVVDVVQPDEHQDPLDDAVAPPMSY